MVLSEVSITEAGGEFIYPCIFCKNDFDNVEDLKKHVKPCYIDLRQKEELVKLEPTEYVNKMEPTKIQKETVKYQNDTVTTKKMKYDWLPFYRREEDMFRCVACLLKFRGLHQTIKHLSSTPCGEGVQRQQKGVRRPLLDNSPKLPKKDYTGLYTKEGLLYVCYTCTTSFQTITGVHGHLKRTLCGFGEEEAKEVKLYSCASCEASYSYKDGMYRHQCGKGTLLGCCLCGKKFASNEEFNDHLKTTCLAIETETDIVETDRSEDGSTADKHLQVEESSTEPKAEKEKNSRLEETESKNTKNASELLDTVEEKHTETDLNSDDFEEEVNDDKGLESNDDESEEFDDIVDNDEDDFSQESEDETEDVNNDEETEPKNLETKITQ